MNFTANDFASLDDTPGVAGSQPVAHRSSQISAGPQYVADVLGRFGAEPADAGDTAPVVRGYN
ncbi:hypothetical protein DIE07_15750 [Burkholderia sp. Bp9002]|nr:hypothetical protein DIE07_15750 [Burkholderia sp. Bp9002]